MRILNVSSGSSFNLISGGSCYTSKAGLETFTKHIGIEETDVKIMAVRPSMVNTEMHATTGNKIYLPLLIDRFEHGKTVKAW